MTPVQANEIVRKCYESADNKEQKAIGWGLTNLVRSNEEREREQDFKCSCDILEEEKE